MIPSAATRSSSSSSSSSSNIHRVVEITSTSSSSDSDDQSKRASYFFVFGSFGSIATYLPLYYESKMKIEYVGILVFLAVLVSTLFTPLWGSVMDFFISRIREGKLSCALLRNSINRSVLVLTILSTGVLRFSLQFFDNFDMLVILSTLAAFFMSPVVPTLDTLLVYSLSDPEMYGHYRLYGSLGFAAFVLIVALLIEIGEDSEDLVFAMWTCLILSVTSALLIFKAPFVEIAEIAANDLGGGGGAQQGAHASKRSKVFREAGKLLCSSNTTRLEFWVVLIVVLLSGALNGIVETFLLIYLRTELNASFLCMGLARAVSVLFEIPTFTHSSKFIRFFGVRGSMVVALLAYCIRFSLYASITNPWFVIPVEILNVFSYGFMSVSSVAYAHRLAPKGLGLTMQTILEAMHTGFGIAMGALIGGLLYADQSKGQRVFWWSATASGCVLLILGVYNWKTVCCCFRVRKGSSSVTRTSQQDYAAVSTDSSMFALKSDLDDIASKGVVDEMSGRGGFSMFFDDFGLSEEKNGYRTVLSYDDDDDNDDDDDGDGGGGDDEVGEEKRENKIDVNEKKVEDEDDDTRISPPPPPSSPLTISVDHDAVAQDDLILSSPKSSEILRLKHEKQGILKNADETKEDRTSAALTLEDVSSEYRERLINFYKKHNPSRLFNVDYLLEKYKGREEGLFAELYAKYSSTRGSSSSSSSSNRTSNTTTKTTFTLGGVVDREISSNTNITISRTSLSDEVQSSSTRSTNSTRRPTVTLFSIGADDDEVEEEEKDGHI
jgi:MFS transporter, PPP family, 3-phenylpropionic acid transporter